MIDVSAITSYIDIILTFIFDNIGLFIGILIVVFGIRSSILKKRRAEAESSGEAPKKKSFMELMREMETELNKEDNEENEDEEGETTPRPYVTAEDRRRNDSPWQKQQPMQRKKESPWDSREPAPEGPGDQRVKPSIIPSNDSSSKPVASVSAYYGENSATQSKIPVPESIDIRVEAPPMTVIQLNDNERNHCDFSVEGQLNRKKLTDAVVMAEILGKPRALRKTGRC